MSKILIDCADPNDIKSVTEAVEKAAGSCTITYAKQHLEMVKAGKTKSIRESAKLISKDTNESLDAVRMKITRGKKKVEHVVQHKNPAKGPGVKRPNADKSIDKMITRFDKRVRSAYIGTRDLNLLLKKINAEVIGGLRSMFVLNNVHDLLRELKETLVYFGYDYKNILIGNEKEEENDQSKSQGPIN